MHGEEAGNYAYGMWPVVVFNILLFVFFISSFLGSPKKVDWRSMGAFTAFIAALFTEMYGFPLTIYLLSAWMGKSYPVLNPFTHAHGHLWLVFVGLADSPTAMTVLHLVSNLLIFLGLYLVHNGWILIHASQGKRLVTEGVYAHVRHPQYSGIFLITIGFLLQWPTIITIFMWPVLILAYCRLALREEKEVEKQFGKAYAEYKKRVPAFLPTRPASIPRFGKGE